MNFEKIKIHYVIALILLMTIPALTTGVQHTNAAVTEWDLFLHVMVSPNPVGLNQNVLVTFQPDKTSPIATVRANNWQGFTVKITKPDGTTETKGPYEGYSTGGAWFSYIPTTIGKYTFQASFPGQWVNGSYTGVGSPGGNWVNQTGQPLISENRWYKPVLSGIAELTVQQEQILGYPDVPLPTDYWTRPIYGENKGWWQVSGNWLMQGYDFTRRSYTALSATSAFAPYTSAPNSAHVLWKRPVAFGGIVGGEYGDKVYYTGLTYEQFYTPLIINGRIVYTEHGATSTAAFGTRCLDLYTGEEVWYLNNTDISFAQLFAWESVNEHGILPYLWSVSGPTTNNTWRMYDAFTGRQVLTIINIPTGSRGLLGLTVGFGPSGEILSYSLDAANNRLIMWNSTLAIVGNVADTWSPTYGGIIDGQRGIQWNVSIPDVPGLQTITLLNTKEGYLLATFQDATTYPNVYMHVAYDLNVAKLTNGSYPTAIQHMWLQNRTNIYGHYPLYSINIEDGIYAMWDLGKTQIHGYDIKNGQELWTSNPMPTGWSLFTRHFIVAYDKVYTTGYDGYVRAFSAQTGQLVWDYYMGSAGYENAYGTWPSSIGCTVADGKVYVTNDEHSPDSVMWRGGKIWCIDAETGEGLWNMSGWLRIPAAADGYITSYNALDNQIYTLGKGPTAITVSASPSITFKGRSVMINGAVTDQSPGQKGTPAISDEDMATWMEYLHMQKPKPEDAVGVPVKLTAIDPNGNTQDIVTIVTDNDGTFRFMWTPPVEGVYKIIAVFDGSESYGSSSSSTGIGIELAPSALPTALPEPTVAPTIAPTIPPTASPSPVPNTGDAMGTEVYIAIAAAVVIAIVAAAALVLRKRK